MTLPTDIQNAPSAAPAPAPPSYDISDPATMSEALEVAMQYREAQFNKRWKECQEYDENIGIRQKTPSGTAASLDYRANVALVAIANRRKVGIIGAVSIIPFYYTESINSQYIDDIRSAVLRWGVRQSGLNAALRDTMMDLVCIGHGVMRGRWDEYALDGMGAPEFRQVPFFSIYIDPQRRNRDINKDSRWVFQVEYLSEGDAIRAFPKYFEQFPPVKDSAIEQFRGVSKSVLNRLAKQTFLREGDLVPIVRVEFVKIVNGKRRIFVGVLDPARKQWIEEPKDNQLGIYSYIVMSLRPQRDHAYPKPPNEDEIELNRLYNLFLSLGIITGANEGAGTLYYNAADTSLSQALGSKRYPKPGESVPYDIEPPRRLQGGDPSAYMGMAEVVRGNLNDVQMVAPVQAGRSGSLQSGRALQTAAAYADIPYDNYRDAVYEAAKNGCTLIDRLLRAFMEDNRMVVDEREGADPRRQMLNVTEPEQQRRFLEEPASQQNPYFVSARAEVDGQMQAMPISQADAMVNKGEISEYQTVINDIMLGRAEITVQIRPERSWEERAQMALLALQAGVAGPRFYHKEVGTLNVNEVIEEVDSRNQMLQMGKMLMENPQLMAALQLYQSDPLIRDLVDNAPLRGAVKQLVNEELSGAIASEEPTLTPEALGQSQPTAAEQS